MNGVTRKSLFAALNQIHDFNAGGLIGTVDLAGPEDDRVPRDGAGARTATFVRVNPTKPGTFDCSPKYVIDRQLDLLTG